MVRFLGRTLPEQKKIWVALTQVYGVGFSRARELCFAIGATPNTPASQLRPFHLSQLYTVIEERFTVGSDLRNSIKSNIQRLIRIRCYRGSRHLQKLPVRGQRTHSNARTQKKLSKRS